MTNPILLNIERLGIGYTNKNVTNAVARGINITLKSGELVALIGANGIGKSTLLRTISGIQKPLSGQISIDNQNLSDYSALALAQKISLVLTEKLPSSNLTVTEIVALGRQPYTNWIGTLSPTDKNAIHEALELAQVTHLADKKHYELSDGQLQKVMIARALAQETPIIILDEPTTHLDLQHKASLFNLLKKLAKNNGKCILFSTHEIDMAIQMSDQIIIMTTDDVIQDSPKNLISANAFEKIFSDKNISFDKNLGKFVLTTF